MKILFLFFILFICGCSNKSKECLKTINIALKVRAEDKKQEGPYLALATNSYDFGIINKLDYSQLKFNIEFENAGNKSLSISKADVSCGCLKVIYPRQMIMPYIKDTITVTIDLRNQKGFMNKAIYLKSNSKDSIELIRLKGIVK